MMRRRRIGVIVLLLVLAISVVAVGCNKKSSNYTLPSSTEIEVGTLVSPDFRLAKKTTAEFVSLTVPIGSETTVGSDGSFTPDVTGRYDYTVRFTKKKDVWTETVHFTAVDRTAPTFGTLADKNNVEIGFYTDIPADIAAATVTDNCAEKVTVYAKSIEFGGTVTEIAPDGVGLFLPKVGTYTVTLVAEDYSGNKAEGTYKINTVDTTPAAIEAPKTFIAWLGKDGKVEVPKVNVVEIGSYTLTVDVTKNGAPVEVEDNKFVAEEGALYTLTYKAVDASNNKSELEAKLRINAAGTVADFTDADEIELFGSEYARSQSGAMYVLSEDNTVTLEYFNYFLTKDWSDFKTFTAKIDNNRGVELTVKAHIRVGGEWKEIAPLEIDGGEIDDQHEFLDPNQKTYSFSLADYSVSQAEGIRLTLTSRGGVDAAIDDIILSSDEITVNLPGDDVSLKALGRGEIGLDNVKPESESETAVALTVHSSVQADVLIGLRFESLTLYARRTLAAGKNDIIRLAAAELSEDIDASALATGIKAVVIENQENYPITVSVESVSFEVPDSIEKGGYAKIGKSYGVAYGEKFEVPNPFLADDRYFSELTISLAGGGLSENITDLSVGSTLSTVGSGALAFGDYTLTYEFKDALGESQSIEYSLRVAKKLLALEIEIPALFIGENELDAPQVDSAVFGADELAQVDVKAYYRERGRLAWIELEDNIFEPELVKWHQFRYVAQYVTGADKGNRVVHIEKTIGKFVHKNLYTFDFEEETHSAIDESREIDVPDLKSDPPVKKAPARYLFDGGYYNAHTTVAGMTDYWTKPVYEVNEDWSADGDRSVYCSVRVNGWMGWMVGPVIKNDIGFNAVRFWLNSARGMTSQLSMQDSSNKWVYTETFEVKAGAHEYFVPMINFEEPTDVKCVSVRMYVGDTFAFDDFEFVRVNTLTMSKEVYNDTYDTSPYEVKRPTLSSDLNTQAELDAAVWELSYTLNGGERKTVSPSDGKYYIDLEGGHGTVVFTWKATVGEYVATATYTIVIGEVRIDVDMPVSATVGDTITAPNPTAADPEAIFKSASVQYSYEGGAWQDADGMSFVVEEAGLYAVRVNALYSAGGHDNVVGTVTKYIFVRKAGNDIIDFEPIQGAQYNLGESGSSTGSVAAGSPDSIMIDDTHAHSGRYSMRMKTFSDRWLGFSNVNFQVENKAYAAITFWAYSETAVDFAGSNIYLYMTAGTGEYAYVNADNPFVLEADVWTKITLKFDKEVVVENIYAITFRAIEKAGKVVWFDDFELLALTYTDEVPRAGKVNTDIALPGATFGETAATVSYRLKGASDWTALSGNTFNVSEGGTYELRYDFGGFYEEIFEIVIDKYALDIRESYESQKSAIKGDTVTLTKPTLTIKVDEEPFEGDVSWTVRYQKQGESNWTTLGDGVLTFTASDCGGYYIEFIASFNVQGDDCTHTVYDYLFVREADNQIVDFEPVKGSNYHLGESGTAYGTNASLVAGTPDSIMIDDTHAHSGKYSLRMKTYSDRDLGFNKLFIPAASRTYNAITFWAYSESAVDLTGGKIGLYKRQGSGTYWEYTKTTDPFVLEAGVWKQITLSFENEFEDIGTIYAITYHSSATAGGKIIWFDDFELVSARTDLPILPTHVWKGEELTLPDAEINGEKATISYRKKGASDWNTVENNKVSFNKEETYYQIKYAYSTANVDEAIFDIYVIDKDKVFLDFEGEDVEEYVDGSDTRKLAYRKGNGWQGFAYAGGSKFSAGASYYEYKKVSIVDDLTGNQWQVYDFGGNYAGTEFRDPSTDKQFYAPITLLNGTPFSSDHIRFSCYSDEAKNGIDFWFYAKNSAGTYNKSAKLNIPKGYSEIDVQLDAVCTHVEYYGFTSKSGATSIPGGFRVDNFRIYTPPEDASYSGAVPTHAWTGEDVTLPTATYNGESAKIYYRKTTDENTENWTLVSGNVANFTTAETYYDLKYVFEQSDEEEIKSKAIYAIDRSTVFMDFEDDEDPEDHSLYGKVNGVATQAGGWYGGTQNGAALTKDGNNTWFEFATITSGWTGFSLNAAMNISSTQYIAVSCYTKYEVNIVFWFDIGYPNNQQAVNIKPGYSEIILDFGSAKSTVKQFAINIMEAGGGPGGPYVPAGFRVDNFRVYTPAA